MPDIKTIEKVIRKADIPALLNIVDKLDDETKKIVLGAISELLNTDKKSKVINKISSHIKIADTDTKDWLVKGVTNSYVTSLNETDKELINKGVDISTTGLTPEDLKNLDTLEPHLVAVNQLISNSYLDFANGMNGLIKGVEHQLNETIKRQVRARLIKGRLTGEGIREISKEIKSILGNQGFSVLLDRGGSNWTLKRYSEMLARTHIIKSNNEAIINRAGEFGIDIVEVSSHSGTEDELCLRYSGNIYSLSGSSNNYPVLDREPPFHPNCKHTLLMRPELS